MPNFHKVVSFYDYFFIQFFYTWAHKVSIKFLNGFLKEGYKVLDIGCATGNFLSKLKNVEPFGIDNCKEMIQKAAGKYKNISFTVASGEDIPFEDKFFDLVTVVDAVYYFQDKDRFALEAFRVLRNNSYLFLIYPAFDSWFDRLMIGKIAGFASWAFLHNTEKGTKHLPFNKLKYVIEDKGFRLIKTEVKMGQRLVLFKKD